MDYVCYSAKNIITTQLCKQVYLACGPVLAPDLPRNCTSAHHRRTTITIVVQTLEKTAVAKWQTGWATLIEPY